MLNFDVMQEYVDNILHPQPFCVGQEVWIDILPYKEYMTSIGLKTDAITYLQGPFRIVSIHSFDGMQDSVILRTYWHDGAYPVPVQFLKRY